MSTNPENQTESEVQWERHVTLRCPRMGKHKPYGDLLVPCPDCYSIESLWRRIPYEPDSRAPAADPLAAQERLRAVEALAVRPSRSVLDAAMTAASRPGEHSQQCPVWTKRGGGNFGPLAECNCWEGQAAFARARAVLRAALASPVDSDTEALPQCTHLVSDPANDDVGWQCPHPATHEMFNTNGEWAPVCDPHGRGRGVPEDRLRPLSDAEARTSAEVQP